MQSNGRIVKCYKTRSLDFAKMTSTEVRINRLLFNPYKDAIHREVLTIQVPESKEKVFDFLKAYTKFPTEGKWKQYKDNNVQFEVEYKDSDDDRYGEELLTLLEKLNKEKIGEEQLYARTMKVDESTLSFAKKITKEKNKKKKKKFVYESDWHEVYDIR
jgi:hypothetical protein